MMDSPYDMFPNQWHGTVPQVVMQAGQNKSSVDIHIVFSIEYIQHRFCPVWKSTEYLTILFYGCGTGEGMIISALRYPYARFVGVDQAPEALTQAAAYVKEIGLENIVFMNDEDVTGTYDMIWSARPLHHYSDKDGLMERLKGLLDPEGLLIFAVDADIDNPYFNSYGARVRSLIESTVDSGDFATQMHELKHDLGGEIDGCAVADNGVMNVPGIYSLIMQNNLQIVDFINSLSYDPVNYFQEETCREAAYCDSLLLRHALAELVNGGMLRHHVVLAFPERVQTMPTPDDADMKNLVAWRSPYLVYSLPQDERVMFSLDHTHLGLDERIVLEDISCPAKMVEIVRRFDSASSLQLIHRRFLPMSWEVFRSFIRQMWECELIYLHRK